MFSRSEETTTTTSSSTINRSTSLSLVPSHSGVGVKSARHQTQVAKADRDKKCYILKSKKNERGRVVELRKGLYIMN